MLVASAIHNHAAAMNFRAILRRLQRDGHFDPTRKSHRAAKLNAVFVNGHGFRRKGQLRLPCLYSDVLLERTDAIDFSRTHIEMLPRNRLAHCRTPSNGEFTILTRLLIAEKPGSERNAANNNDSNVQTSVKPIAHMLFTFESRNLESKNRTTIVTSSRQDPYYIAGNPES